MSGDERGLTVVTYAAGEVFHPRCAGEVMAGGILLLAGGMTFWPAFEFGMVKGWPSLRIDLPWLVVPPLCLYGLSAGGFALFAFCRFIRIDACGITWRQLVRTRRVRWEEVVVVKVRRGKGDLMWVRIVRRAGLKTLTLYLGRYSKEDRMRVIEVLESRRGWGRRMGR